jgi:hypothetical protein
MASEPPDSDDPFQKYDKKRAEDAKKTAEQPPGGSEPAGNGADPPPNGQDNVIPISQGRRRNTKPKKEPPDVKGIVEATSELALQRKFSDIHGESLQFIATAASGGKWYYWNGERWQRDDINRVQQLLKEFLWAEARSSLWVEEGKRLASNRTVRNLEALARSRLRRTRCKPYKWHSSLCCRHSCCRVSCFPSRACRPGRNGPGRSSRSRTRCASCAASC